MSGWGTNGALVADQLRQKDYAFVLIQETKHITGAPRLSDPTQNFRHFEVSGYDPNVDTTAKGGIVTYINNAITAKTELVAKCHDYLATCTGLLLVINVYLPNRSLASSGRYSEAIDEIIALVVDKQQTHGVIIAGDFNTSENSTNLKHFNRLKEYLELSDWTEDIPYTFSQGTKGGVCHTKLDHILTKNLSKDLLIKCETALDKAKGGHIPLVATARIPHIEIEEISHPTEGRAVPRPDFNKVTSKMAEQFRYYAKETIKKYESQYTMGINKNPLNLLYRTWTDLEKTAEWLFPQHWSKHRPTLPGYREYVETAQTEYAEAYSEWVDSGKQKEGEEYDRKNECKRKRDQAFEQRKQHEDQVKADKIAGDFAKGGNSQCWAPIRETIKGNNQKSSAIIEGLNKPEEIGKFWREHYKKKLKGTV